MLNAQGLSNTLHGLAKVITNLLTYLLNEVIIINAVSVFPNPTNDFVKISSKLNIQSIEFINITGQVLFSETVNSMERKLQLQNYANGIYFIKLIFNNEFNITKKIIINN